MFHHTLQWMGVLFRDSTLEIFCGFTSPQCLVSNADLPCFQRLPKTHHPNKSCKIPTKMRPPKRNPNPGFPGKTRDWQKNSQNKNSTSKTHPLMSSLNLMLLRFFRNMSFLLPTANWKKKTRMLYTPMKYWFFNRDPNDLWNHHITMSKMSWTHYQDFSLQVTFPWPTCISQEEAWDMAELHPMAQAPSRSSSTFTSGWFLMRI